MRSVKFLWPSTAYYRNIFIFYGFIVLGHVGLLLGNDREISSYTTAVAR
jgi:hypothetical protein